jgi:DNA-binding transcriptional ArsR family regulator/NAD-dependent dihydropyrimidine dehydrogenase PreA subunit
MSDRSCYDRLVAADLDETPGSERDHEREAVERVAGAMQGLAAPNRVRIIARLRRSPCSVTELAEAVEMEQSAVSHHLRLLRDLGLVVCYRRGRKIIYALHRKQIRLLLEEAFGHVERPSSHAPKSGRGYQPQERDAKTQRRWPSVTYIIAEPCIDVKDKSCVDVCPVDCIHEVGRMLVIDPEECIDCGACEPECPVEAIYPEDALPDKWEPFVKINYAYPDSSVIDHLVDEYATEHNVQNTPPGA